jgi:hypothetical protein
MKSRLLCFALFAAGALFGQISLGIRIGPPPPPRVVRVQPRAPGVGYTWVEGYWYPVGSRYRWHDGYWSQPPYAGARWEGPRYEGGNYLAGHWDGDRGRMDHDHRWDKDRKRRDMNRFEEHHDEGRR